jgi:hypothetical protein
MRDPRFGGGLPAALELGDGRLRHPVVGRQQVAVAGVVMAQAAGTAFSAGRLKPGHAVADRVVESLQVRV